MEETKCYCGHTTYCDCGPEEPKQECMITKIMQMDAEMAYDSLPKQALINMIKNDEELGLYDEPFKHKVEAIPAEEILANRSNAYEFIDLETIKKKKYEYNIWDTSTAGRVK